MVSVYFWAQLQKHLIICADGEMLEEEFFLMPETALSELGTL